MELLERLAALTPRPRVNLILYYGVLAPRASLRSQLVNSASDGLRELGATLPATSDGSPSRPGSRRPGAYLWADLMREQQLNGADVGAGFQKVYRERVAQRMERDGLRDATSSMRRPTGAVDRMSREGLVRVLTRKEPVPGSAQAPPLTQDLEQLRREHHIPIFLPFPLFHAEDHPLAVDRRNGEVHGFRDTKPGGVTGRQDRAMLVN